MPVLYWQLFCLPDCLISPIYAREITGCIYAKPVIIYLFSVWCLCIERQSVYNVIRVWLPKRLLVCLAHTCLLSRVHCGGWTISSHRVANSILQECWCHLGLFFTNFTSHSGRSGAGWFLLTARSAISFSLEQYLFIYLHFDCFWIV